MSPGRFPWATFESKHDSCLHQHDHVKVGPGSLLRNTLHTAGETLSSPRVEDINTFIVAALLLYYIYIRERETKERESLEIKDVLP